MTNDGDSARDGNVSVAVTVDGESFTITPTDEGGYDYSWISGPHDYGFTSSGPIQVGGQQDDLPPAVDHEAAIRGFLAMINPRTGFID